MSTNHIDVIEAKAVESSVTPISFMVTDAYSEITAALNAGGLSSATEIEAVVDNVSDAVALAGGITGGTTQITSFSMVTADSALFQQITVAELKAISQATNFEAFRGQISVSDDASNIVAEFDFMEDVDLPREDVHAENLSFC